MLPPTSLNCYYHRRVVSSDAPSPHDTRKGLLPSCILSAAPAPSSTPPAGSLFCTGMNVATMQRAATMAPSRSAGALRRSNNALRSGAAARVRPQPCRQRVVTQAAVLPTAVRAIADMVRWEATGCRKQAWVLSQRSAHAARSALVARPPPCSSPFWAAHCIEALPLSTGRWTPLYTLRADWRVCAGLLRPQLGQPASCAQGGELPVATRCRAVHARGSG